MAKYIVINHEAGTVGRIDAVCYEKAMQGALKKLGYTVEAEIDYMSDLQMDIGEEFPRDSLEWDVEYYVDYGGEELKDVRRT